MFVRDRLQSICLRGLEAIWMCHELIELVGSPNIFNDGGRERAGRDMHLTIFLGP